VIRAFIAVEIAAPIIANIAAAANQLRADIEAIRWVAPNNTHLTLKFLGAIDETQVEPIAAALSSGLRPFPPCTINAKGLGVFPNIKRPRVLWVGLLGSELITLAEQVELALAPLGFSREERGFTPHLTIGRWRQGVRATATLPHIVDQWRDFDFGWCTIGEVVLFQSVLKPQGAIYTRLKVVPLAA
jgi:RNA 2',3'-cyclic 3'-phosphodiesterase